MYVFYVSNFHIILYHLYLYFVYNKYKNTLSVSWTFSLAIWVNFGCVFPDAFYWLIFLRVTRIGPWSILFIYSRSHSCYWSISQRMYSPIDLTRSFWRTTLFWINFVICTREYVCIIEHCCTQYLLTKHET